MKTYLLALLIGTGSWVSAQDNLIPYNKNGVFGLCDIKGDIKVKPQYSNISFFNERTGGYIIRNYEKYGLINKQLKEVIPPNSSEPIFSAGENRVGAVIGNEIIFYDKNSFQEVKRQKIEPSNQEPGMPITAQYPDRTGPSREEVIALFKKKYGNKYKAERFNAVSANETYFDLEVFAEGKSKSIGLFLPKTNTFLLDEGDNTYSSAVWIPSKNSYYITVIDTTKRKSVITEDKKVIFEPKEYKRLYVMPTYIGYSEPNESSDKAANYYIINSGKAIKNQFSDFRSSGLLTVDGKGFQVFSADIENPDLHKSQKIYIGENGEQYFEVDFKYGN
ncbi:hypothetical protein CEY12_02520 [Chryseobacterium sp. T16E-39]|uniref:WG repeat-containing protein n=1 Tax=Chryseobacterium sp. T16E-39 TaxID=2015076 RepID=UPI000B5B268C|nr:WG repeat-containing protein [Chryseobacterium sp. T16E-39]ASK29049.1 hypothetical protein CEY12_02520 [Chryseobacterium sp. T16E-39]